MKLVLAAFFVAALAAEIYLWRGFRTSYSGFSGEQIERFERAHRAKGPDDFEARFGLERIDLERRRRAGLWLVGGAAFVCALGAYLVPSRRRTASRGEEERFQAAFGDAGVLIEGSRQKAAQLLGVTPNAPAAVLDAALQAQLAALGPSDPRREALQRAHALLLQRRSAEPHRPG